MLSTFVAWLSAPLVQLHLLEYRVSPLDEVLVKLLPDNIVLLLCFCQLQKSQDVVDFVAHRINEGVDLAGLFLLR